MVDQSGNLEVTGHFLHPVDDAGWARTGDNTAVPTKIQAQLFIADPPVRVDLYVHVDGSGRAHVRHFGVTSGDLGTPVTTRLLRRLPVDTLLREVLDRATVKATLRPDIAPRAFQVEGEPDNQAWVSGGPPPVGRGRDIPRDRVERAAQVYKDALRSGSKAPGEVVRVTLGYSRATAARDIRAARERGLLPPLGQEGSSTAGSAITGTGRITRMSADEVEAATRELGLQGPGPKGKRFADWTPEEMAELAARRAAAEGSDGGAE